MSRRSGFTVVEVLTVTAILGLLMSLLVVAVQKSRATARRLQCANNLKQIGIAVEACVAASGEYPTYSHKAWADISRALGLPVRDDHPSPMQVPVYKCPGEDYPNAAQQGERSYTMNAGTHFRSADQYRDGYMTDSKPRPSSAFTDGLSQTAFFSERLITSPGDTDPQVLAQPQRYLWWTPAVIERTPGNEPAVIQDCETNRTSQLPYRYWSTSYGGGYDHRLPPNRPGCWNGPFPDAYRHDATAPASSNHSGGVNVLYGDGHVSFVSDAVDITIWRALGTINGGESVGEF
ncbi:MAG: DUF1559 domain-containing protein [Planctomyces sp.]|nr:DUF1559 domain-containing protein [Planctomyces sp.]